MKTSTIEKLQKVLDLLDVSSDDKKTVESSLSMKIDPPVTSSQPPKKKSISSSRVNATYNDKSNPLIAKRNMTIQAIYQFLEEEGLYFSKHALESETKIAYDAASFSSSGTILEALDLREHYYSSQIEAHDPTKELLQQLNDIALISNEKISNNLLFSYKDVNKTNCLCVDIFSYENKSYIIVGSVDYSLTILLLDDDNNKLNVITKFTGIQSPPLYIEVDPKHQRWCLCSCMDGSVYLIDLLSHFQSSNNNQNKWEYDRWKQHNKYVVMVKWSKDSKYFLTASHDHSLRLFEFVGSDLAEIKENEENNVRKPYKYCKIVEIYDFEGCVEAVEWIGNTHEFVVAIRDNVYLHYYNADSDENVRNIPFLKCNMNVFGDTHISFSIGFLQSSKDGKFLLAKTDQERVILYATKTEYQLKVYYGAHSDPFTYTRAFFSPDSKYIYASHHNSFIVFDIVTGQVLSRVDAHDKTLRDMVIDPVSGYIITTSFDRSVKVWNSKN